MFNLNEVGLGVLEPRVGEALGEDSVVGEQEEPLAVSVKPAGRIDTRDRDEVLQGRPTLSLGELGQDVVRLVEGEGSRGAFRGISGGPGVLRQPWPKPRSKASRSRM